MNKDLEKELLALGKESSAREAEIWESWRAEHPGWGGRDGGPTEQLQSAREDHRKRYLEIMLKYKE